MTRRNPTLHIVVVGGGIAGAFAAYFAARAGADVVLVERGEVAGEASSRNPGGLNPMYGPGIPGPLQPLALEAYRLHLDAWDEVTRLGGAFDGRRKQRLNLAMDERDVAGLERMKENYDQHDGFSARWLDRDELLAIEPRLAPDVSAGLLAEGDGRVDPGRYTNAVVGAAVAAGAEVVQDRAVGLDGDGRSVRAVRLDGRGRLACDAAVLATGVWSADPERWLGVSLPTEPVKGELLRIELAGGVATDLAWRDAALYRVDGDTVMLGGTEDRTGFECEPSEAGRSTILAAAAKVVPEVQRAEVVAHTAGLRPLTPDGMPVIGVPEPWQNVCVLAGGGRKGMLFGAAMGKAAADLLTEGATHLSIAPCAPDRFAARTAPAR